MAEREPIDIEPTLEELEKSRLYFVELTDALMHYGSRIPKGRLLTLTTRTDQDGNPNVELVSETRFPPLDDMPEHFKRLEYSAKQLDRLPCKLLGTRL